MEENQPITARWNTQDVSVQARAELEKAHPVGEVSAVVCWWGLCHATKWQILTDANFPLLDADGNKVGTWDRIMWGKQEKMRWRSLIGFVFWCFVSSFTLGINSEKVHFRCMALQPPSLEMLVLTTSVAGCPKSSCASCQKLILINLMKRIPTNPMLQGLISNYVHTF